MRITKTARPEPTGLWIALVLVTFVGCRTHVTESGGTGTGSVPAAAAARAEAEIAAFDAELERRSASLPSPEAPDDWRWVRAKLTHMVDVDQFVRTYVDRQEVRALDAASRRAFDADLAERWLKIDRSNTDDLKELLETRGWFSISEYGPDADRDAWLLVQHADHDRDFQREILGVLAALVEAHETDVRNYAYLHDRVAVGDGRPQRFGTQGQCVGPGRWEPYPIEDAEDVDVRRAAYELEPLADYAARFVEFCP